MRTKRRIIGEVPFKNCFGPVARRADATELQARNAALVEAQAEVERLYTRWAELDRTLGELAKP